VKKSTKGAVAASAAALLLLGGMGTQAGWTDQAADGGGTMASGYLRLDATCDGWLLDGVAVRDLSNVRLIPGSDLMQVCRFTVDMLGTSLSAELDVSQPQFTARNGLTSALQVNAEFRDGEGDVVSGPVASITDGEVYTATLTVALPDDAPATAQDLTAVLGDITVTARQV
jgi:alternate signal-mediated exported protein